MFLKLFRPYIFFSYIYYSKVELGVRGYAQGAIAWVYWSCIRYRRELQRLELMKIGPGIGSE
jgi:hypothetical protein